MASPSERDVKRLFAASGNRCAFPRCTEVIAKGAVLLGEICHISGNRPTSARHDTAQTDAERQAFDNLILLCPNHHKTVDDDEESYTVGRLRRMKATHEAKQSQPVEDHADEIARALITQTVSTVNQSGGIAASVVTAGIINIHPSNENADPDRARAIKDLWGGLVGFQKAFSSVVFLDNVMTSPELDDCFAGRKHFSLFDMIDDFRDRDHVMHQFQVNAPSNAVNHRLVVSPRLWALYGAAQSFYGRTAMLITLSFKQRKLQRWQDDDLLRANMLAVFPQSFVDTCAKMTFGGLSQIETALHDAFLKEGQSKS